MGPEIPKMPTPEEMAKTQKERILSDAELVKGGADVTSEGIIRATEEQKKDARVEMGEHFYNEYKRLTNKAEILSLPLEEWRTLAEPLEVIDMASEGKLIKIDKGTEIQLSNLNYTSSKPEQGVMAIITYSLSGGEKGLEILQAYVPQHSLEGKSVLLEEPKFKK